MRECEADEVILETEITNTAALKLYESMGFLRDKRLQSYYLTLAKMIKPRKSK